MLKQMLLSAAQFLEDNKETVNALNVFPVPDGDTGTNMSLTMQSAAKEILALKTDKLGEVAKALSKGSLKGARGNSGVILSQLFRGFAEFLKDYEQVDTVQFAKALMGGSDKAYKAVMKPVEGTMLTVARVTAEKSVKIANETKDFTGFFSRILDVAKDTLDNTPNLLPVLKQAGVVDSGGMGVLYIMMGAANALDEDFDLDISSFDAKDISLPSFSDTDSSQSIEFGYCTEFFIKNLHPYIKDEDIEKLKQKLERFGDSIVVVGDMDLIKVHFHTNMPGKGLQLGLRFGELSNIKIDNMREQHSHNMEYAELAMADNSPEKDFGILSVAMGEGIANLFKDLNADYIIEGGQTMNPSIEDILNAANKVRAKEIFILPNNSNIVLSAKQAAELSDKPIHVIPTKSIPQGLAALIAYNPELPIDENNNLMLKAIEQVKTGQVTYAVRDSNFDNQQIQEGDFMGLSNGTIMTVGKDIETVTQDLLKHMVDEDDEIITLLYGKDATEETTNQILAFLEDTYPDIEVELLDGGQPLYYYIISVE
ncbi:MAG: DAK2 domain-containing protein [Eubacteriales bacterium]|nr:DAK2 domain-containing protein [Clostridia bacterium]MDI9511618.1 DAK2 domain-containing protein [Bacillota bacterium]